MDLNKLKELLRTIPYRSDIVLAIVIFLCVWFIAPWIKIGGIYPFASGSARAILLSLAGFIWLVKYIIGQVAIHKSNIWPVFGARCRELWSKLKIISKNSGRYAKEKSQDIRARVVKDKQRRQLKKLPWYLILGTPQAGKKTLIANSGLYFARPEHFGQEAHDYIQQFPDFDWWYSEQAVLVDSMSHDTERDTQNWKRFVKFLRHARKHKPLNGIVLVLSLADVILYTNQQRQEFIQDVCKYVRDIHDNFKAQVPVYIVLNKCDLVEGFMEFFNDLSKEELNQVWGMTLPLSECSDSNRVSTFFTNEYQALMQQLKKRVLWALDSERNQRGRELIYSFPQAMQLFKKPIDNLLIELFGGTRYPNALQVRGLYFTSGLQESEPYDFLMKAMSKKFQLVPPTTQRPQRMGECYFLRRLFYDVILPEGQLLGESEKSKTIRRITYRTIQVGTPVFIIACIWGMHTSAGINTENLRQTQQAITLYQADIKTLKPSSDALVPLLPPLNELNQSLQLYKNSSHWSLHLLYASHYIRRQLHATLHRALSHLFLPRVAAQLEDHLNENIQDQNLVYAMLKGYLTFSPTASTRRIEMQAPMEYMWNKKYKDQEKTKQELQYYLIHALKYAVPKLPLDQALINRTRVALESIVPAKRAYGLLELRSHVSNIPALVLTSAVGDNFAKIFVDENKDSTIPALYTYSGFRHLFSKDYHNIAAEVAEDNQAIGLSNESDITATVPQITRSMHIMYNQFYLQQWSEALKNIQIKPFVNLKQAIKSFDLLVSPHSPFARLLDIVYDNTAVVQEHQVKIKMDFSAFNAFSRNQSKVNWKTVIKTLGQIRDYFIKIKDAPNQDLTAYKAAVATIKGKKNPIQQLSLEAQKAPPYIKAWLQQLAHYSWEIILQGAHRELNSAWQQIVMVEYNNNLRGRYPLNAHSRSQVSIASFNRFFSAKGTLATYFNKYLKPFVNTEGSEWKLYVVNGYSVELPMAYLHLFQRAQAVRNNFFNKTNQAKVDLSIRPLTLDAQASSIRMIIGNHTINYSHGPQHTTHLAWPLAAENQVAAAFVTNFRGTHYSDHESGPWALFKLLQQGSFRALSSPGHYEFSLNLHGYHASFGIQGAANMALFKLAHLKGFRLPNKIAPTAMPNVTVKAKGGKHDTQHS